MEDVRIEIKDDKKLVVEIILDMPGVPITNLKMNTYGALRLAEELASRFFIEKELMERRRKQTLDLVKPNGVMPPLGVA